MGAVDLAPAVVAVGGQPEVGFVEVAEQQELAHLPRRREAQDVLHALAPDLARCRPRLVLPAQRERLVVRAVPRRPRGVVAVGRERAASVAHQSQSIAVPVATGDGVIDLEDAQRIVLEACPPLGAGRRIDLRDALGLVLAGDVVAGEDVPPFANTAVDGYAVRAADLATAPAELTVVGEVAAGAAPSDGVARRRARRCAS